MPGVYRFLIRTQGHDLIPYESFTVFVVTKNRSRETTVGEYTLRCVAMENGAPV